MHSRLEQYIEQVETRLVELPPAQRESETGEMRQHLAAMVEARMESGLCEEKAITETLEQFGRAQTVSRQLTQVHQRRFLPDNLLTAMICSILCTYGGAFLLFMALVRHDWKGLHLRLLDGCSQSVQMAYVVNVMLIGCLTAGAITGALFPRRAQWGTLLPYLVWWAMGISNTSCFPNMTMRDYTIICGFWIVTGSFTMLGAKAGAVWHRRRLHRRRLAV